MQKGICFFWYVFCCCISTSIFFLVSCGDSSGNDSLDNLSIPAANASATSGTVPFSIISLGSTSLENDDTVLVTFSNTQGYSVTIPAAAADPLEVSVPLYVNPVSGVLDSGTVSLTVQYPDGVVKTVAGSLTIEAPPIPEGLSVGTLTNRFLKGTLTYVRATQTFLDSLKSTDTTAAALIPDNIDNDLTYETTQLNTLVDAIAAFLNGDTTQIMGSMTAADGEVSVTLDSAMLANSDRIIAAFLTQWKSANASVLSKSGINIETKAMTLEELAESWYQISHDISDSSLAWGKMAGSAIGAVTAVVGVSAALVSASPMIAAAGTTAALIGAMGFVVSTFEPAATSIFLNAGTSILLYGKADDKDVIQGIKYALSNTLSQGISYLGGTWIEASSGELSSALAGLLDYMSGATERVSGFMTDCILTGEINSSESSSSSSSADTTTLSADSLLIITKEFDGTWIGTLTGTLTYYTENVNGDCYITQTTTVTGNISCSIASGLTDCSTTINGKTYSSMSGAVVDSALYVSSVAAGKKGWGGWGWASSDYTSSLSFNGPFYTTGSANGTWSFATLTYTGSCNGAYEEGTWMLSQQ